MGTIVHQVLLADLDDLAKLLEVSDKSLGLSIVGDGELVPIFIGEEDDAASVYEMKATARECFPGSHELDLIVLIHETPGGNDMVVSTRDMVCLAWPKTVESYWWTFTNTYLNRMH